MRLTCRVSGAPVRWRHGLRHLQGPSDPCSKDSLAAETIRPCRFHALGRSRPRLCHWLLSDADGSGLRRAAGADTMALIPCGWLVVQAANASNNEVDKLRRSAGRNAMRNMTLENAKTGVAGYDFEQLSKALAASVTKVRRLASLSAGFLWSFLGASQPPVAPAAQRA